MWEVLVGGWGGSQRFAECRWKCGTSTTFSKVNISKVWSRILTTICRMPFANRNAGPSPSCCPICHTCTISAHNPYLQTSFEKSSFSLVNEGNSYSWSGKLYHLLDLVPGPKLSDAINIVAVNALIAIVACHRCHRCHCAVPMLLLLPSSTLWCVNTAAVARMVHMLLDHLVRDHQNSASPIFNHQKCWGRSHKISTRAEFFSQLVEVAQKSTVQLSWW